MDIITKEFGKIQIEDLDIITFIRGIYGFEEYTKFVILKENQDDDIMYLQSVENTDLHFVIVDPYAIVPTYSPILSDEDIELLKISKEEVSKLKYVLVAIISEELENSVINLKSPIVINPDSKCAIQSILMNQEYPLRYPLFSKQEVGETCAGN